MERGTFRDEKFIRPLNDACVPLVMPTSYKEYPSVTIKGEKRYKDYPRLTIDEAKGFTNSGESAVDYKEYEKWVTPCYIVVNAAKEHLVRALDRRQNSVQKIFQDIQAAQGKLGGKGVAQSVYRSYLKTIDTARKSAEAGEFAKAIKGLAELEKTKGTTDAMKKEIGDEREKIVSQGENQAREAQGDKAKLEKLAEEFKGHPLEAKIREMIK